MNQKVIAAIAMYIINRRVDQNTIADELGISASYLSQLLNGTRPITANVLYRWNNAYGSDPDAAAAKVLMQNELDARIRVI